MNVCKHGRGPLFRCRACEKESQIPPEEAHPSAPPIRCLNIPIAILDAHNVELQVRRTWWKLGPDGIPILVIETNAEAEK